MSNTDLITLPILPFSNLFWTLINRIAIHLLVQSETLMTCDSFPSLAMSSWF